MYALIKRHKFHFIFMGFLYAGVRRKANDLWFDNDFKDVFPDIFYPYRDRYEDPKMCIIQELSKQRYNPQEDIVLSRKKRKI